MRITDTRLPDVKLIEPDVFHDERGFFLESFNQARFDALVGQSVQFVQDNHSHSRRGVVRGLHYQLAPRAQGKLIRVLQGTIFDVAVDIRHDSPTFGLWSGTELTADSQQQIWIPPGFAHGFMVLSESADVFYKTTNYWCRGLERGLRWNDPKIGIAWPGGVEPILAEKDRDNPGLDALVRERI